MASSGQPRGPRKLDRRRDHVRGGDTSGVEVTAVIYGDFLCPYCRRLRRVFARLRKTLGERLVYAFRHFPNEEAHPGARLLARGAEAAARQGRFWEMHDALFAHDLPLDRAALLDIAKDLGLDLKRFRGDLENTEVRRRVDEDIAGARHGGVTATPTIYIEGERYDGAWDYHSILHVLEQPFGVTVKRTARAFANLPSSAALVLLAAGAVALVMANSPLAPAYRALIDTKLSIGLSAAPLTLTFGQWCAEGLLSVFYFVLGLEIRREIASGHLSDWRAAITPFLAAVGGVAVPALMYFACTGSATDLGWSVSADTGIPFTLAIMALFGERVSGPLKTFIAIYAVADDLLTTAIQAIFYPKTLHAEWLLGAALGVAALVALNRGRIFAAWPYVLATAGVWLSLHVAGVSGAMSGILLAACIPPRPAPDPAPLLAQAATALAELEHAEHGREPSRTMKLQPIWDWASRNLAAAADRLLSPAERAERASEPWSTYLVLPLFAFTAAGAPLFGSLAAPKTFGVFAGVALAFVLGKPLGVVLTSWAAARLKVAKLPTNTPWLAFVAAACLCGIGDPFSLLMADQAFGPGALAAAAKSGVFAGSLAAAALGAAALAFTRAD